MTTLKLKALSFIGYLIRLIYRNKIRLRNTIISTDSNQVTNLNTALIHFGRYEKDELELCEKYLSSELDIVELGTSIGVVASYIRKNISKKKMICVEANPMLQDVLKKTFKLNQMTDVKLLNVAVSDSNKPVYFSGRGSNELGKISEYSDVKVDTKSLAKIIQENEIGDYYLVCDIEGAECSFILGNELNNCRLAIIELHPSTWNNKFYSVEDLSNLFIKNGFEILEKANNTYVFKRASPEIIEN